jgi:large subunit ribosomal protein L31e
LQRKKAAFGSGGAEMSEKKRGAGTRKDEVVTREYTINLHKRLHGWYRPLPFLALLFHSQALR